MAQNALIDPLDPNALDLREIIGVLAQRYRWPDSLAADAELWYRRFLKVTQQQPRNNGQPQAVFGLAYFADLVWHEHMIFSKKYRQDCENIFGPGQYLDHTPETPPNWQTLIDQSNSIYLAVFELIPPYSSPCCT